MPGWRSAMTRGDYAVFLAALVSFFTSVYLWFSGQRGEGVFVGIWVPSILAFGAYVKLAVRGPR
jgi:hypothetical protein